MVSGAVLAAGLGLSGQAAAGWTGNVGAVSEYMFRGIAQTGGAAVQGGIDYESDFGLYAGTWASNIGFGGGTEQDFYVGFGGEAGDFGYDLGLTWYWYPEEDETGDELSTLELYASLSFGPVSLSAAWSDETNFFIGDGAAESALYLKLSGSVPLSDGLSLDLGVGNYSGDEVERALANGDDNYTDLSVALAKTLDGGYSFSLGYVVTDIDDDDPKLVLGLTKSFDL